MPWKVATDHRQVNEAARALHLEMAAAYRVKGYGGSGNVGTPLTAILYSRIANDFLRPTRSFAVGLAK